MTLIASVSGIRGTIGGKAGSNLTPVDIIAFTSAYAQWLQSQGKDTFKVVIGRDARPSGRMLRDLVSQTLCAAGIDVIDCDLATTPTVEMEVVRQKADGGIILTASHNPENWNALKLLNHRGEFLSAEDGAKILDYVNEGSTEFAPVDKLGKITETNDHLKSHIQAILDLPEVNVEKIAARDFSVVVDGINSVGALAMPALLSALGVKRVFVENADMHGYFAHNPEPLKEHLGETMKVVLDKKADMGIIVDPDVDRLAFIDEKGEMFGEEYTLVAAADFWLSKHPGPVVSNMSSSRALEDLAAKYNQQRHTSAVGEVHVVTKMKEVNAVIGGEGNGGVILPALHYGRDALVGVALVLTHMAETGKSLTELRAGYARYEMSKNKVQLGDKVNPDSILEKLMLKYSNEKVETIDGLKINFDTGWVHMRKSNTEPIIRIYSEAPTQTQADDLAASFVSEIQSMV
ncbi:MAG: phosphoglucosamine mutase [Flavobacteriales bacterium]|nr:MAG: phosphoglucosamine mutase [Flavobacteriales bacterium]